MVKLKRSYDPYKRTDGFRILVDRLWPRGLSKEKAHIGLWLKEIAPSTELRKWFAHDPERWPEFKKRYAQELRSNKEVIEELKDQLKKHKIVTLVYSAKDEEHNNALELVKFLKLKVHED